MAEDGTNASPPGRESRDDWRTSRANAQGLLGPGVGKPRNRSRSPHRTFRRPSNYERQFRYEREGTNTMSVEPHLQRARLFVGNIDPDKLHRRDMERIFSQYGEVLGISVHKGYAFVQMDRERSANKAVNFEDNQVHMGNRLHVEFSQAALKAGAKSERLSPDHSDPLALLQAERDREERLARMLQMERELAYLRTRDEYYDALSRRPHYDLPPYERGSDSYRRGSPPTSRDYPHSRDEFGYRAEERRGYYDRQSEQGLERSLERARDHPLDRRERPIERLHERSRTLDPPRERGPYERGLERRMERPPSPSLGREPISYPIPASSRGLHGGSALDRREGQYGSGYSMAHRSGPSLPSSGVGYGGSGGSGERASSKPSGGPPPGWPSDRGNPNRPPFANAAPWN